MGWRSEWGSFAAWNTSLLAVISIINIKEYWRARQLKLVVSVFVLCSFLDTLVSLLSRAKGSGSVVIVNAYQDVGHYQGKVSC